MIDHILHICKYCYILHIYLDYLYIYIYIRINNTHILEEPAQ